MPLQKVYKIGGKKTNAGEKLGKKIGRDLEKGKVSVQSSERVLS